MTAIAPPLARVREKATTVVRIAASDSLYRNSFLLMANTIVQTGLGSLFWLVAARRFAETDVGLLTTTLSAVVLVSTASCLGFPNALVRHLPRNPTRTGEIVLSAAALAAAVGVLLFVASSLTPWGLPMVRGDVGVVLVGLGLVTVVASVAGMLCDAVFIAQRSSHLLLLKNSVGGVLKVIALVVLPVGGITGLALANLVGLLASVGLTAALLRPRVTGTLRVTPGALDGVWSFSLGNHAGMIFGILPLTATPLIVLSARGATDAAFFGITMMLLGLLNVVPAMLSQSLFAELSANPVSPGRQVRRAGQAIALLMVPAVAILVVAAPVLLGAFGPSYADGATSCLRWMALGSLVASASYVIDVWVNSLGRAGSFVLLNASNATFVLLAVAVAAPRGLTAVGIAWLLAQSASVVVAAGVLVVVRRREPNQMAVVPVDVSTFIAGPAISGPAITASAESLPPVVVAGQPAVRASRRLPFLDGLRGVAAAFVVISHCWSTVYLDARDGRSRTELLTSWMGLGHYAVSVFIVISGFSLGLVAWRGSLGWPGGTGAFLRGRFRRIVPPYWAAVAIGAVAGATVLSRPVGTLWDGAIPIRWSGVVSHLALVQDVAWAGPAGSTAFWSLAVEWHIYLLFPFLVVFLRMWPQRWLPVVLVLGVIGGAGELFAGSGAWTWVAGLHPSLYALFVLGFVTARHTAQATDHTARRRHERRLLVAATFGLVVAAMVTSRGIDPVSPVHDLWFGPMAALVIGRLAIGSGARAARGPVRRLLETRCLVWLGMISYSLYLIHSVVIESVWRVAVRPFDPVEPWSLVMEVTLGLGASIAAAALFHRLVERRFTTPVHVPRHRGARR